jgi:hypothetical protein
LISWGLVFFRIFAPIARGLLQAHPEELHGQSLFEAMENRLGYPFRGGVDVLEFWNFHIEVLVVIAVKDLTGDHRVNVLNPGNHAGFRVRLSRYRYFQEVVVSVPVRVTAFSEEVKVLFVAQMGEIKAMRGAKVIDTGEGEHGSFSLGG